MKNQTFLGAAGLSVLLTPAVALGDDAAATETITVVSSRIAQPLDSIATSVEIFDQARIDSLGQLSVADTLRAATGVNVSNSGGLGKNTTLRIRGEDGFRTRVYIDGVALADPSAPQVTPLFDDILAADISRIEVLRGPQGLAYGADAGGVVSIRTQPISEGFGGAANVQLGRYDTQQLGASLNLGNDTGGVFIAVSDIQTDGFNAQTADTSGEADGYDNTSVHLKGELHVTDRLSAQLVVRDMQADNAYDGCFSNVTFTTVHDCRSDTDNTTSRLSLDYQTDTVTHQLSLTDTQVERQFFSEGLFAFANEGELQSANYLGSVKSPEYLLVYGADIEKESLTQSNQHRYRRGVFAEGQWLPDDTKSASLGIRYDNHDAFGSQTSVRLGGRYQLLSSHGFEVDAKATYGTGFRAPSLFEQAYNDGSFAFGEAAGLQLNEEHSKGMDLGVEWRSLNGLQGELIYYNQSIDDQIVFDNIGFQGYLQVEGTSRSQGLELSMQYPVTPGSYVWGNYTYNDSDTVDGQDRLRRPRHVANLGLVLNDWTGAGTLGVNARRVQDAVDIGGTPLDDYLLVNLTYSYPLNASLTLNARVDNLTDEDYQEVAGFNTAERSLFAGLRVSF